MGKCNIITQCYEYDYLLVAFKVCVVRGAYSRGGPNVEVIQYGQDIWC